GLPLLRHAVLGVPAARSRPAHVAHRRSRRRDEASMRGWVIACLLLGCGAPSRTTGSDAASLDGAPADASADASADAAGDAAVAPDPMQAFVALDPSCADDWCWYWPAPTGNAYFQVYATGADNIWITGARGTIFQWTGEAWTRHHPPPLPGQDFV